MVESLEEMPICSNSLSYLNLVATFKPISREGSAFINAADQS